MKLTPEYIAARVVNAEYWRPTGTRMTVCVLTLVNGFAVAGTSSCIYDADFNEEIGRKLAYADAVQKIWELEGYLARTIVDAAGKPIAYQERA